MRASVVGRSIYQEVRYLPPRGSAQFFIIIEVRIIKLISFDESCSSFQYSQILQYPLGLEYTRVSKIIILLNFFSADLPSKRAMCFDIFRVSIPCSLFIFSGMSSYERLVDKKSTSARFTAAFFGSQPRPSRPKF